VDAGGRQIDARAGVLVLRFVPPLHCHLVALREEARLKTTHVRGLEAIPACPEALPMSEGPLVPMILPAIRQARSLIDQDVLVVDGCHAFCISVLDRLEQAPGGLLVCSRQT